VNGLDVLWLVYRLLPVAFFIDLMILTFGVWGWRRWKRARIGR